MMKININLSNKKILLGTAILLPLVILAGYYLASKQSKNQAKITNFESVTTLSATPSSSTNPFQGTSSKLVVSWTNTKTTFQNGNYPSYETLPLVTDINVDSFASILGFTNSNRKSLPDNDVIWKKGEETLLYISSNDTLDYQNQKKYTESIKFNETNLVNRAKQFVSALFPQTTLTVSPVVYYADNAYVPVVTNVENSLLAEVNFNQTLDDHLLIPANLKSEHFITLFITPDLVIQSFRNSPGFLSKKSTSGTSLADFEKLKTIPTNYFRKLTNLALNKESLITFSKKLNFSVASIDVAYTIIGSKAVPVYYIEGSLFGDNIKVDDHVVYLAPLN